MNWTMSGLGHLVRRSAGHWPQATLVCAIAALLTVPSAVQAAPLLAGAAKVDITNVDAGPVNDPLYVRALVVRSESITAALITLDAVAIGEIGYIKAEYLPNVRRRLQQELGLDPHRLIVNTSHCHGVVCTDVEARTVQAVQTALQQLTPVKIGAGVGREDRIMENRRLRLKNGKTVDVRHAYALPPDVEVAGVGPVDPEIGILRLDRLDGRPLAVVYNFACHPIQGVPSGGNTADLTGFASQLIEDSLGDGAIALFVQGCGGDINPAGYKDMDQPRNAEHLGHLLGHSTLQGRSKISTRDDNRLAVIHETLILPRADNAERIAALESEQQRLLQSLRGTTLNLKSFVPLLVKYGVSGDYPSHDAFRYLHEETQGRNHLRKFDDETRRNLQQYMRNIHIMEELTRLQTNLALLRKHQAAGVTAGKRTVETEVVGLRIGDFVLLTFPGELTVQIGLNLKQAAPHKPTFIAGYTNGYIYYAPTAEQLLNAGNAQEDSDCILAPEWEQMFVDKALSILKRL